MAWATAVGPIVGFTVGSELGGFVGAEACDRIKLVDVSDSANWNRPCNCLFLGKTTTECDGLAPSDTLSFGAGEVGDPIVGVGMQLGFRVGILNGLNDTASRELVANTFFSASLLKRSSMATRDRIGPISCEF